MWRPGVDVGNLAIMDQVNFVGIDHFSLGICGGRDPQSGEHLSFWAMWIEGCDTPETQDACVVRDLHDVLQTLQPR